MLLLNPTFVPVDAYREEAHLAEAVGRLATGRSGGGVRPQRAGPLRPVTPDAPPSVAQWARDAVAVLDAAVRGRVHVLANADTGMIALHLAAEHPDRIASVTAVNPYARASVGDGYPHGEPASVEDVLRGIRTPGARPPVDVLTWIAPAVADDARFRAWWDAAGRRAREPPHGRAGAPRHRGGRRARPAPPGRRAGAAALARRLPFARPRPRPLPRRPPPPRTLEEHPDPNGLWFLGDVDWVLERFAAFVAP